MFMFHFIRKSLKTAKHHPRLGGLEILKSIRFVLLFTIVLFFNYALFCFAETSII